jgi:transcriptional regulator
MYVPAHFEAEEALVGDLIAKRMAILVTAGENGTPWATHVPMLWDAEARVLTGHIARANPHPKLAPGARALVIVPGLEAYVSPSLYASKAEHGRVVPTWNYEAVHLEGALTWFDDAARLEAVVRALSDRHEAARAAPWSVDDAPADYVRALLRGIVGVEIAVDTIQAKRKLSQNKSAADIAGVREGLAASDEPQDRDVAALMATLPDRE